MLSVCLQIPSATTVAQLLLPHFALGLGIGVIDAALVPLLATFVDATLAHDDSGEARGTRSSYGTVYAIQQTSVSLAYCLGKTLLSLSLGRVLYVCKQILSCSSAPLIGGELAQSFGFAWLMRIVGLFNILYGPILVYIYQKYDPKVRGSLITPTKELTFTLIWFSFACTASQRAAE